MKNNPLGPGQSSQSGFTLMEVMVAVLIVGITLGVLLRAANDTLTNTTILRNTTIAQWVAENKLSEIRLRHMPLPGKQVTGVSTMMKRDWFWRLTVKSTPDPNVKQLAIQVSLKQETNQDKAQTLVVMRSFLYDPK
jgi:general secretion pathway protein I